MPSTAPVWIEARGDAVPRQGERVGPLAQVRDLQAQAFLDRRDEVELHPRRLGVTSRFRVPI